MEKIRQLRAKYRDVLLDHPILKVSIEYVFVIFMTAISAFLLAYNFRAFVKPSANVMSLNSDGSFEVYSYNLIAGGVSGLGQVIVLFLEKLGVSFTISVDVIQSIIYFSINVPLFLLAFFYIGKRFAILSLINVLLTSMFISLIPESWTQIFAINNDLLARAICAGVVNGTAISIAVHFNHSTGGTDIVSMYFGLKKGKSIGIYVLGINLTIVILYVILSSITTASMEGTPGSATMGLYTLVFFFTSSVVIDHLSTRNKKVQLQIVTTEPRLAKVLIQNFPHGCTVLDGKGAFQDTDKKIILTVISSFELKRATQIVYKVDPQAFITVNNAYRVYGKFFIRPMK